MITLSRESNYAHGLTFADVEAVENEVSDLAPHRDMSRFHDDTDTSYIARILDLPERAVIVGMTPVELVSRFEALGMSQTECASVLNVSGTAMSFWVKGKRAIPPKITNELNELENKVEDYVDLYAEFLQATTDRPVILRVKADDRLMRVAVARARMMADDPSSVEIVAL